MNILKKIIILIFYSVSIYASDIVINVDPNPVVKSEFVRLSVVSEISLDAVDLVVGSDVYELKRVSDKLYRLKFKAFSELGSENTFVNIIFSNLESHILPVEFNLVEGSNNLPQGSLDVKSSQAIKLDNTKLEIERLEDKIDILDQKNKTLNRQIRDLNQAIKNQKDLAISQEELDKQRAKLFELQAILERDELARESSILELKRKMEVFNQRQQALAQKERQLQDFEFELSQQSTELIEKGLQLDSLESDLALEAVSLKQKNDALKKSEAKVYKDKKVISQMKSEIKERKSALTKKNKQIIEKEKLLDRKIATIELKQSTLSSKEKQLENLSDQIKDERLVLVSISSKLDKKRKELANEKNKFYEQKEDKEKALEKTQSYIQNLEKQMLKSLSQLSSLEKDHVDRSFYIQKEKEYLKEQQLEYEQDQKRFDKDYQQLKVLESEIAVRVDVLNDLGSHIDSQIKQMQYEIGETKKEKDAYQAEMSKKVDYLNNLTQLIENRAEKIQKRNRSLKIKNQRLSEHLYELKAPRYRYSFAPYMGVRYNNDSNSNYDEVGLNVATYFSRGFVLSAGLGSVNYMTQAQYSSMKRSTVGNVSLSYLLNPREKIGFYIKTSAKKSVARTSDVMFGLGLDLKYQYKEQFSSFLGASVVDGAYFSFGIEKYIVPTIYNKSNTAVAPMTESLDSDYVVTQINDLPPAETYFSMEGSSDYYIYFPYEHKFNDVMKPWYKDSVLKTVAYGFFDLHDSNEFNPQGYLTYEDVSYSLAWMWYIEKILKPDPMVINFSLISDEKSSFLLTFSILDQDDNIVGIIQDKATYITGKNQLSFDPSEFIDKPGNYKLRCEIYTLDVVSQDKSFELDHELISFSDHSFKINLKQALADFPSLSSEFSQYDQFPYLRKGIQLNWFQFVDSEVDLYSNIAVTRLEFIEIVGRFLLESGARSRDIDVDLSYYQDLNLIPKDKQHYLKEYVIELGYGGDKNKNLNPFQYLTRAEFAVIMNRLLLWKQKHLQDKNIKIDFNNLVIQ
jgi:hypothetical protein